MLVWVFVRAVVDGWSPSCEGRQGPLLRHFLIRSLPVGYSQHALEPSFCVFVAGVVRGKRGATFLSPPNLWRPAPVMSRGARYYCCYMCTGARCGPVCNIHCLFGRVVEKGFVYCSQKDKEVLRFVSQNEFLFEKNL